MKAMFAVVMLTATFSVNAQYKCVSSDGKVSFQQSPCPRDDKQHTLDIRAPRSSAAPNGPAVTPPSDSSSRSLTADQRLAAKYEFERKVSDKQAEIEGLERRVAGNTDNMNAELESLRRKKGAAKNNLAGATWEQSISTEMNAVTAKYKAMIDLDLERLQRLRVELADLQKKGPGS